MFVDNEGTGDVYSSLITRQSWDYENLDKDEALISIYRQGEITGSFTDNGNGEKSFCFLAPFKENYYGHQT